eukprot:COSAG04_NODE_4239_length_2213_cov_0.959319_2_plen_114_part_00
MTIDSTLTQCKQCKQVSLPAFLHLKGILVDGIAWVTEEFEAAWRPHEAQSGQPHGHDGNGRTIWLGCFVHSTPRLATLIEHPVTQGIRLSTLGEGDTHEGGDGNYNDTKAVFF